jgi:hypothetical protein
MVMRHWKYWLFLLAEPKAGSGIVWIAHPGGHHARHRAVADSRHRHQWFRTGGTDLPAFVSKIIEEVEEGRHLRRAA